MTSTPPPDYPPVIPYLVVQRAAQAIQFYKSAFGAQERYRLTSAGSDQVGHAELLINGQVVMLADEFPGMSTSPETLKGTTTTFVLMVPNADEAFARATKAGAKPIMPPCDMFYGFRMGSVQDPFGHKWMLQHRVENVAPDEMQKRWDAMVERMKSGQSSCH